MAEINFNQVYDGVTLALHHAFPKARIHGGVIKQNLQDGDFNVLPITTDHTEQMGVRAKHKTTFDIIYYPSRDRGRAESVQVAQQLTWALRTIQTPNGDKLHCLSFNTTIEDDSLHCLVGYPYFIYTTGNAGATDSMKNIKIE